MRAGQLVWVAAGLLAVESCFTVGDVVVAPTITTIVLGLAGWGNRIGVVVGSVWLVVVALAVGKTRRVVVEVVVGLIAVVAGLGKLTGSGPVCELESRDI